MSRKKIIFIGLLGAIFLFTGLYFRIFDPPRTDISYEYLGIGTWTAGLVFFALYPKYKEPVSFILGLLVLHAGVLLILKDQYSNPKLLGLLVFISGIVMLMGSGFSDYMIKRKAKK